MAAVQMNRKTSRPIQSVARAMAILKAFEGPNTQLGIAELSRQLRMAPSTVYRLVMTLEKAGFLEQDLNTEKYQLGIDLFRLGSSAIRQKTLDQHSQLWMERLAEQTREDVRLAVMHEGLVVFVKQIEGSHVVRAPVQLGATSWAHSSSSGKVILAWLDEDKIDAIIQARGLPQRTPRTITSPAALKEHLRAVREKGYAVDDEESVPGVKCVAAPVRNHLGTVVAALSVGGPVNRLADEKVAALATFVTQAANSLSRDLGFFPRNCGS